MIMIIHSGLVIRPYSRLVKKEYSVVKNVWRYSLLTRYYKLRESFFELHHMYEDLKRSL